MSAPTQRARRRFAADARSVAEARRFTRDRLAEWGAPELRDVASLAVSELVTNAVVHTGTAPVVELLLEPHRLRLAVEDSYPGRVVPTGVPDPPRDAEGGRGLLIMASLASSWGVEYTARSKVVWLVCDREPSAGDAPDAVPGVLVAQGAAVAVVELSAEGGIAAWNADATTLLGWEAEEVVGSAMEALVDPASGEPPRFGSLARSSLPWQGRYSVRASDGVAVPVFASHVALNGADGCVVLLVPAQQHDLLEHVPAAATSARAGAVQPPGLPEDALRRLSMEDYLALATERVHDALDADACYLLLSHDVDESFEVAAVSGLPDWLRGTRMAPGEPGAPDLRHPTLPVVLEESAAETVRLLHGTDARALAMAPMVTEGRVVGALATSTRSRLGFTDEQCALLQRYAESLSLAADRLRLRRSERDRRSWLSFVAEAGGLLAASLDQDMTMAITGQIVVPRLATWCAVHLDDERGHPVLQQVWHADEGRVDALRDVLVKLHPDELADSGDAELSGALTTLRLVARGRGIGHLTLGRPAGDPLRDDVRLVADSIARRSALAIDNATTYGTLVASGRALQSSLLPPSLLSPPDLDVGVVYEAAGEGAQAGGDFYDLFPVDAGTWCFVVGDVCGTGAEAAAVTGLARHTIRALTRAGLPIAPMLERLNAAILDEGERSRFLTLVCGTLRPRDGGMDLGLVCAGHPEPFVVGADGNVRRMGAPQSLLGVVDRVEYAAERHVLARGELLVAVTDGVLERRAGDRFLDDDGVVRELTGAADLPAQAVAERLRRLVVDFAEEPQRDDMAILALRVRGSSPRV